MRSVRTTYRADRSRDQPGMPGQATFVAIPTGGLVNMLSGLPGDEAAARGGSGGEELANGDMLGAPGARTMSLPLSLGVDGDEGGSRDMVHLSLIHI